MNWISHHKVIIIVGVIVVIGFAWWGMAPSSTPSTSLITADTSQNLPPGTQDLVQSLLTLRAVSLDGTIFSSPSFQSLQDFSTQIVPEPSGRTDPFAPLGSDAASNATGAQSSSAPSH